MTAAAMNVQDPEELLARLSARLGAGAGHAELRWHANASAQLSMRKGVLMENRRSRAAGVSARVYQNGLYGFAAVPREDGAAMDQTLADARRNAGVNRRHAHSGPGLDRKSTRLNSSH